MSPDSTTLKRCSKCGELKPATPEYFHRSKSDRDGWFHYCKPCACASVKRTRSKNRKAYAEYTHKYNAEHPEWKYQYDRAYYEKNKPRILAQTAEYKQAHKEWYRQYFREYRKTEHGKRVLRACSIRRKSREKNAAGTFSNADIKAIEAGQRDKNGHLRCWWCDAKITEYHIDHRVPLARGGTNYPNNLCLSCPRCNTSRQAKMPHEIGRLL